MIRRSARLLACALGLLSAALAPRAAAQGAAEGAGREASRHFQRGVDLYGEGDFRGALVEFRQAYRLLPRASVLYNIGQTEYQVQEYAQALRTLERFLAETGPNAAHRAEVREAVGVLRTRVGWIALTSDRAGCEVTVDDQAAGTTPLSRILVSIGRRKLGLHCPDRQPATREIEVASGETVRVSINLGASSPAGTATGRDGAGSRDPGDGSRSAVAAWTSTAVLATATLALYGGAIAGSRQLAKLRATYPVAPERLENRARLNHRLALAGDILAVATVAAAGLSTYLQLSAPRERGVKVGLTRTGLALQGRF